MKKDDGKGKKGTKKKKKKKLLARCRRCEKLKQKNFPYFFLLPSSFARASSSLIIASTKNSPAL